MPFSSSSKFKSSAQGFKESWSNVNISNIILSPIFRDNDKKFGFWLKLIFLCFDGQRGRNYLPSFLLFHSNHKSWVMEFRFLNYHIFNRLKSYEQIHDRSLMFELIEFLEQDLYKNGFFLGKWHGVSLRVNTMPWKWQKPDYPSTGAFSWNGFAR